MIKKFNGVIPLPGGEILDCGIEIETTDFPLPDEELIHIFNEEVRKMRERIQTITFEYPAIPIPYDPTGPIVESTQAERSEE